MIRYRTIKQIEISGKESYILERPNGTRTSALTKEEMLAIIFYPDLSKIIYDLSETIANIPDSTFMFGNEIHNLIGNPLEETFEKRGETMIKIEESDESVPISD